MQMAVPQFSRKRLADRLRQNWTSLNPNPTGDQALQSSEMVDDSLTSLAWLQNLNVLKLATSGTSSSSAAGSRPLQTINTNSQFHRASAQTRKHQPPVNTSSNHFLADDHMNYYHQVDPNAILDMTKVKPDPGSVCPEDTKPRSVSPPQLLPQVSDICSGNSRCDSPMSGTRERDEDYRCNHLLKPPYSFASLICMAMHEAPDQKVTLSGIYSWIADNFAYYRETNPTWQNSIRHNLSLNKCFQKVARSKDEPGKGGFWTINPEFQSLVDKEIIRKRRPSNEEASSPSPKKARFAGSSSTDLSSLDFLMTDGLKTPDIKLGHPVGTILNFGADTLVDALDMSWTSNENADPPKQIDILNQAMTSTFDPASSGDSDSDDLELNSLLQLSRCSSESTSLDQLDLTVTGVGLKPPEWWSNVDLNESFSIPLSSVSGTGLFHSPSLGDSISGSLHPWAENQYTSLEEAFAPFDNDQIDIELKPF